MVQFLFFLGFITLFMGCSNTPKIQKSMDTNQTFIYGYSDVEQNISNYIDNLQDNEDTIDYAQKFEDIYYLPLYLKRAPMELNQTLWPFRVFHSKKSYGSNLCLHKKSFLNDLKICSNNSDYDRLGAYGFTTHFTNLRVLPTDEPLLANPKKAGEGLAFDYLQNSAMHANEPLYISHYSFSHYSLDRAWLYVFSAYASGWLHVDDVAFFPKKYNQDIINAQKVYITKEHAAFYDEDGHFIFNARIGMILPIIQLKKEYILALAIQKDFPNKAHYVRVKVPYDFASVGVLAFNQKNINKILSQLLGLKYGWGGMYKHRDCSSTLRDYFTPFGIWLPRNSYGESQVGTIVSFEGKSDAQKLALIKKEGKPFKTLLYKHGHILLYIGMDLKGRVLAFHNMWGLKILKDGIEGRKIVGKTVITTLDVGKNIESIDANQTLLHTLKSMNIVF